jgi:hypothetical protein
MYRTAVTRPDNVRSIKAPSPGTPPDAVPVAVRTLPSSDDAFRTRVETTLAAGAIRDPVQLVDALRDGYPSVLVTRQDALGHLGPDRELWYVYRDGHLAGDGGSPTDIGR